MPQWLLDLAAAASATPPPRRQPGVSPLEQLRRDERYWHRAISDEITRLSLVPRGLGLRHAALRTSAIRIGQLVHYGAPEREVRELVSDLARLMDQDRRTAINGLEFGIAHPRPDEEVGELVIDWGE
jgi:hypothetical protein